MVRLRNIAKFDSGDIFIVVIKEKTNKSSKPSLP